MRRKNMKGILLIAALTTLSLATVSQGATITWGAATAVSTSNDVSTTGVLVEAFNAGFRNVSDQTVNGVRFTGTGALLLKNSTYGVFSGDTGDAAYNALLSSVDFGGGASLFTIPVGNGNLLVGAEYLIQVWYVDTNEASRVMQFGDGNGNTVGLASTPGQFAIGTFAATGTNQALSLFATNFGQAHIAAYQIRATSIVPGTKVSIPESTTTALLGGLLALSAVMVRRRR
jgi:hypothetical protein